MAAIVPGCFARRGVGGPGAGRRLRAEATATPVYYVSEALAGPKTWYTEPKKMAYLLVMASRKLRHYFLAHDIMVLTSYPLGDMLRNREATGRIGKWAIELASFTISFVSRSAIKSQILADFIVERTRPCSDQPEPPVEEVWIARTDGACNAFGASFAISFISRSAITSPIGRSASFAARLEFPTTNNTAEYEAIMLALRKARAMGAQCLVIHTDSQVVAGHIDKSYQARSPELAKYLEAFRKAEACFRGITVSGVPRATIADVDALAKAAAGSTLLPSHVLYEVLRSPAASDTDAPAAEVAVIDT